MNAGIEHRHLSPSSFVCCFAFWEEIVSRSMQCYIRCAGLGFPAGVGRIVCSVGSVD